ncbi:DNA replication/repair protein RecF [candidate division WOR-3 bacterium]|nr:DNA replication/repair protein RecF [candidate division WOR-3 bacterium]
MSLQALSIQGFRNLTDTSICFSEHFNFFAGNNGAGKTNLLEAIYVAGTASSFRARENRILIKNNEPYFRVEARTETTDASIYYDGTRKKLMRAGNEVKRLSEYVGWLGITMLSIEDLWIVRGAPAQRRSFFNWLIAKVSPRYLDDLLEYRKLVNQRNRVLQSIHNNGNQGVLDAYNERFITMSNRVYQERKRFIPLLQTCAIDISAQLGLNDFAIDYHSTCPDMNLDRVQVEQVYDREVLYGRTVIGPHRDDLRFSLEGQTFQQFASEGQERAAAISLKLAEATIIERHTDKRPILVLDEASGELDTLKRQHLLDLLDGQVFYASTQFPSHMPVKDKNCAYYTVQGGIIEKTAPH